MFYQHFVLAKKGPLARIWLAAHWDKKLTKAHVFETNIEKSVDGIVQPKVKMALRTSGHLLLGVVRIYSRKAKYLLADCNEAFVKIKMAFRPGMVDLPEDIREAAVSAITFPEVFHDFDTPMPELNDVDIQAQFTLNQSRAEEITMREDYGNISLVTGDDGFGDIGFEEPSSLIRATSAIEPNLDQTNIFGENIEKDKDTSAQEQNARLSTTRANALDLEAPIKDDGFGGNLGQDIMSGGLFEGGLFDDTPIGEGPPLDSAHGDKDKMADDSDDDGADLDRFNGPPSVGPSSTEGGSPYQSPRPDQREGLNTSALSGGVPNADGSAVDQTTLLHNEEESFALEPIDSSTVKAGWPRTKRKRKLIVDEVKNISGEEMKAQLSDTTDIVTTLDLAPPSKRLMHWKETGGVEKLFALPGRSMNAQIMSKMYIRHLTSEHSNNEDFGMAGDKEIDNLRLEQVRDEETEMPAPRPRGRPPKRKLSESEEDRPMVHTRSRDESFNELLSSRPNQEKPTTPLRPEEPLNDSSQLPPPGDSLHLDNNDSVAAAGLGSPQEQMDDHHDDFADGGFDDPMHGSDAFSPPPVGIDHHSPSRVEDGVDTEEQADDETYEEFEERVVNKRAGLLFQNIKKTLKQKPMSFTELIKGNGRKQVAQKFYTLLVLKKLQAVELMQEGGPYAQITVSRGHLFENASL